MGDLRRHLSELHNDNTGVLCCEDLHAHILLNVFNCSTYTVGRGCGSQFGLMNSKLLSKVPGKGPDNPWSGPNKSQSIPNHDANNIIAQRYSMLRNACPVVNEIGFKAFCESVEWQTLIGCKLGFRYSFRNPYQVLQCTVNPT